MKQLNGRAKETGVDVTDTINGTVQFSDIGTTNMPLLLEELVLHGLVEGSDFNKKMGVKELAKILSSKVLSNSTISLQHGRFMMLDLKGLFYLQQLAGI
jgi:hypothetical protein